jgi:hypothetical protein
MITAIVVDDDAEPGAETSLLQEWLGRLAATSPDS